MPYASPDHSHSTVLITTENQRNAINRLPDDILLEYTRRLKISKAFRSLNFNELIVIGAYYGLLGDGSDANFREIGEKLGISYQRVSQIQTTALGKLKARVFSRNVMAFRKTK